MCLLENTPFLIISNLDWAKAKKISRKDAKTQRLFQTYPSANQLCELCDFAREITLAGILKTLANSDGIKSFDVR
jgi:hypothetical protein